MVVASSLSRYNQILAVYKVGGEQRMNGYYLFRIVGNVKCFIRVGGKYLVFFYK